MQKFWYEQMFVYDGGWVQKVVPKLNSCEVAYIISFILSNTINKKIDILNCLCYNNTVS